jgi:REP element-mobilizing transposase RayT
MTHKKRIWYPGAKYHIICRGNKKRDIFLDKLDFRVLVAILKEVKNNYSLLFWIHNAPGKHDPQFYSGH